MEYEEHPPTTTGTGEEAMNSFRFNGSVRVDTCSAETTVPCMTSRSRPASTASGAYWRVFCGVRLAAVITPPESLISWMALTDQRRLDRFAIDLSEDSGGPIRRSGGDLVIDRRRILVAGPQSLQVQHPETTQFPYSYHRGRAHS